LRNKPPGYLLREETGQGVFSREGEGGRSHDIMLTSLPLDVLEQFHISATEDIAVKDKVILDDLGPSSS
jgi:hypothetical protein